MRAEYHHCPNCWGYQEYDEQTELSNKELN